MSLAFADNNVLRVTILHNPEPNSEPGGFFFWGGGRKGALTRIERKGTPVVYLLLTQMVPLLQRHK